MTGDGSAAGDGGPAPAGSVANADLLRSAIGSVLARDASRAILAPGALVALRLLFRHLGVESLVLSDREYYAPEHFPACQVRVAPVEAIPEVVEEESPDAVVVSLVSWRGEKADVAELMEKLGRDGRGRDGAAPAAGSETLVCVDWCHAGALGFPPLGDLDADLVFGDTTKWLISMDTPDRLAFLVGSESMESILKRCFAGLYLSGGAPSEREARWVDPQAMAAMARSVNGAAADRAALEARHARNVALARTVAEANGLPEPATAILWIPGVTRDALDLSDLPSPELAWETSEGVRIICQADDPYRATS